MRIMRKRRLTVWGGRQREKDGERQREREGETERKKQLAAQWQPQLLAGKLCSALCRNCGPGRVVAASWRRRQRQRFARCLSARMCVCVCVGGWLLAIMTL